MQEKIIELLENIKPGIDYMSETDLVEHKILESLEILRLVSDLSDEFDIDITLPYVKPANFKTVDAICNMVQTILDEE